MKTIRILPVLAALFTAAAAFGQIQVIVDGQAVAFRGQQPIEQNDRVLVPLRGVFEKMGADVVWNPESDTVTAMRGDTRVRLHIGSTEATVNGQSVMLDVAPMIMNGSTMVPLRFISESLGGTVDWQAYNQTVAVNSGISSTVIVNEERRRDRPTRIESDDLMLARGTVIPVRLETDLSSAEARTGDRFEVRVRDNDASDLAIPRGTEIDGYVAAVHRYRDDHPGMLELKFDKMRFPDGRIVNLDGTLIGLDSNSVTRENGRLIATASARDNRGIYAGYGAGAGFILGLTSHRPLEDAILGGLLGLGIGEIQRHGKPNDVTLNRGTEFGVRLNDKLDVR